MGIFSSIRDKIFGKRVQVNVPSAAEAEAAERRAQAGASGGLGGTGQPLGQPAQAGGGMAQQGQQGSQAQNVDVDAVLADMARQKGQQLNYKSSIVDLMKLLDLDPTLENRKELATELGYTGEKNGSAEMNIWLHKAVMQELEKNGGKVSAELRD